MKELLERFTAACNGLHRVAEKVRAINRRRIAPESTDNLEALAIEIHEARERYLNSFGSDQQPKYRKELEDILFNDKGTFTPALFELVDRRRAAAQTKGTTP